MDASNPRSVIVAVKTIEIVPVEGLAIKSIELKIFGPRDDGKSNFIRALADLQAVVPGVGLTTIGRFRIGITNPVRALPPRVQNEAGVWEDDPSFPQALRNPKLARSIETAIANALGVKVDTGELGGDAADLEE